MYRISKLFRFEASHRLPLHDGKCQRLHGHSWVMRVSVEGQAIRTQGPKSGMLMDYSEIKDAVQPIVDQYLDHYHLNDTTQLENPTSEELAKWVYDKLKMILPMLKSVEIDETCTSSCHYEP